MNKILKITWKYQNMQIPYKFQNNNLILTRKISLYQHYKIIQTPANSAYNNNTTLNCTSKILKTKKNLKNLGKSEETFKSLMTIIKTQQKRISLSKK